MNGLLWLCFSISGAAALALEVLWMRSAGLVLGATAPTAATVLACYFAGLGLGPTPYAQDDLPVGQKLQAPGLQTYSTAGLHPHDAKDFTPALLDEIRGLARDGKVVAVGECGLDFYRNLSPPDQQRHAFVAQIELAREVGLPLVIHDRDAHDSVVGLLAEHGASKGVMSIFNQ